jgi:GNAT superfamily N-acetyltransferase
VEERACTLQPARREHYDELLEMVFSQSCGQLRPVMDLVQLTYDHFGKIFRSTGVVYRICLGRRLAGMCWVEERGRALHLHGLVVKERFRGRGLGTQALSWLEQAYAGRVDRILLLVHCSNMGARSLYERCGYRLCCVVEGEGFLLMEKPLSDKHQTAFLGWLLQARTPTTRYWTLRDLLERPETDAELQDARLAMVHEGPIPAILANQGESGSWSGERSYYTPKYTSSHWSMLLLAELDADGEDPRLVRGAQFMLTTTRAELRYARRSGKYGLECFWGNLLRYCLHCSQADDPQMEELVDFVASQGPLGGWRCPYNGGLPCAWGAVRDLWGLAALPENLRSPKVGQAIQCGLEFLLRDFSLVAANYPSCGSIHSLWFRLNFPLFYQADILFSLRLLDELGALGSPEVQPALDWLAGRRNRSGRWRGSNPFRLRTYKALANPQETSRLVSLQAARLLKHASYPDRLVSS